VAAVDALMTLRNITSETVHLAVPNETGMVFIEKLESPHAVRMASRIGTRVSMTSSAVGKAYLASLDPAACDAILAQVRFQRYTDHTMMDLVTLRKDLMLTREQGYAEDREENEVAIFCYGAAIRGADGSTVGCVSISMPTFRHDAGDHARYTEPLVAACRKIGDQLGPAVT
jgi:DNA-binding IclR family transcriptional regulator